MATERGMLTHRGDSIISSHDIISVVRPHSHSNLDVSDDK